MKKGMPERIWKNSLGNFIYTFAHLETQLFLICACFMELEEIKKITFSKKVDKAIGFLRRQFSAQAHPLIDALVKARKLAQFRNDVVHNPVFNWIRFDKENGLDYQPGYIMVTGTTSTDIKLQDLKNKTAELISLSKEISRHDRMLKLHELARIPERRS
ncbi:hypothetical protein Bsp3421_002058 [Burkholderia sp. FERM BP-3421]|jgi:hypothetical protein|uniref:hypothetical protein n=1 Tax=Burkholderia sp. FERM BP-3421 TaxID=1494466 RepID=UPI0023620754|nr:hypothetical protein [Burkholderia sp. FERM BP-3421]WDD92082.1 hypothetical protein Bsp3421_002058 [Burkholderia sp. FERM BP-3421]